MSDPQPPAQTEIISPDDPEFQLGHYLHDAEVLHADVRAGESIEPERIKTICERYACLIHLTGLLRAECNRLRRSK
jgi:hypothetical protein